LQTVIHIQGHVEHSITLDPTLWIFDDRRLNLDHYFNDDYVEKDELEEYKKSIGKHWSREIMEGATFPPTIETEKEFELTKTITGTYGIYLKHFLKNASPKADATTISFEDSTSKAYDFPIEQVDEFILKYCIDGKPIKEDGPVYILLKDGSNRDEPIKNIVKINIR